MCGKADPKLAPGVSPAQIHLGGRCRDLTRGGQATDAVIFREEGFGHVMPRRALSRRWGLPRQGITDFLRPHPSCAGRQGKCNGHGDQVSCQRWSSKQRQLYPYSKAESRPCQGKNQMEFNKEEMASLGRDISNGLLGPPYLPLL